MSVQIQQRYGYSNIKSFSNQGDYNFYGIIYDATFPIQEDASTYTCNVKIVDPELNLLTNPKDFNDKIINIVVKSSSIDALPFIHRIGDIIRVHRAVYKPKQRKNVYVNVGTLLKYKSAWILFSGESDPDSDDYSPIACSSSNYTFESIDKQYLRACRQWIKLYFRQFNSLLFQKESKLSNREYGNDFDALVKIIEKQELPDKIVYFILDETDGCELHAYKYFNFFNVNDVVRVRSLKLFESNKGVFIMNKFSNILKVNPFSDLYMEFMNNLAQKINVVNPDAFFPLFDRKINTNDLLDVETQFEVKKNIIIEPDLNDSQNYPIKKVTDISNEDSHVILTLNILEVIPRNIADFASILNTENNESQLAKTFTDEEIDNGKYICKNASDEIVESKMYYNLMFIATENPLSNQNIKLYLSCYDGQGESFMKYPVQDFSRNTEAFKQMNEFINNLTKSDSYVQVLVEVNNSGLSENDFIFRIVGGYKQ